MSSMYQSKGFFEPRKFGHYQRRCHELIGEIWGDTFQGRKKGYLWLKQNFNIIHFAEIHDEKLLKQIYEKLWKKSFEVEGFDL